MHTYGYQKEYKLMMIPYNILIPAALQNLAISVGVENTLFLP